jgi:hypothetical protein
VPERRYTIERLNDDDPEEVYEWAFGSCRVAPMNALTAMAGSPDASREEIVGAVARKFPEASRDAARAGCRAGFAARDADTADRA